MSARVHVYAICVHDILQVLCCKVLRLCTNNTHKYIILHILLLSMCKCVLLLVILELAGRVCSKLRYCLRNNYFGY